MTGIILCLLIKSVHNGTYANMATFMVKEAFEVKCIMLPLIQPCQKSASPCVQV